MSPLNWDPQLDAAKGKTAKYQVWDTDKGIGLYVNDKLVHDIKYDPTPLSREQRSQASTKIVEELKREAERRESGDSSIVGLSTRLAAKHGTTERLGVTLQADSGVCMNNRRHKFPKGSRVIYKEGHVYCTICGGMLDISA